MEEFCGSQFWNNNLTWFTEDPDLTVCFQKTVLVWAPCFYLWIFLWMDVVYIKRSMNANVPWGILNVSKLILTAALISLSAIDVFVAMSLNDSGKIFPVDFYTPLVKMLTFVLSSLLVYLNKKNGMQASGVLFFFWFLLFVFSVPQFRSEIRRQSLRQQNGSATFWDEYNFVSFMTNFALTAFMFLLNCLADQEPLMKKYPKPENPCPEKYSNFVSRLTFAWFDKMAWKGYKMPLKQTDLWELKPEDKTTEIVPSFAKHWQRETDILTKKNMRSTKKIATLSIVPVMWKTFGVSFLFATGLKLAEDIILFVSPQLLGLTIDFIDSSKEEEDRPELWKGFLYASLLFVVASLQTVVFTHFYHRMYMVGFRIRTALISAIYRKALVVSNAARKETTVGEITNLMSIDADRFTDLLLYINLAWSAPLQIAIAMYFLWSKLGPSVLAGFAVMLLSMPITGVLLNVISNCYTKQMAYKDDRIKMMSEILNGIKVLKLYAWENSFQSHVNRIRSKEIKTLRKTAFLDSVAYLIWATVPFLVSLLTFGVFVLIDEKNVLTPQIAFVALNLFNIIRFPLVMLPDLVTNFVETKVSVDRINKFLNSDELDAESIEHYEEERAPLLMEDASFSWEGKKAMLSNLNIRVGQGELVAVVGSVGSGKSSLLAAFLGEMEKISGRVNTVGKIAYVSQQAWIQNCTLQENILFGKPLDQKRYREVITSCALKPDFEILPAGDQTEIGEKGINLSGGQKQRVSLARAVYNDADIYFLDDPLSAVDSHVGQHIFDEVIGPTGLLDSKTRVMVTHAINFLPKVDNILVLKNGEISETGSYTALLSKKGAFAEFLMQYVQETNSDEEDAEEFKLQMQKTGKIDEEFMRKLDRSISRRSERKIKSFSELSRQSSTASEISVRSTVSKGAQRCLPIKDTLIMEEELQVGSVKLEVYKHYVKSVGMKWLLLMLSANILFQVFSIGSNLWLSKWSTDPNAGTDTYLRDTYLSVYGAFGLLLASSGFLLDLAPRLGGLVAGVRLHETLLHGILRAPLSFFETTPTGRILSRFAKDIDAIDNSLPRLVSDVFGLSFEVLATMVVISTSTYLFLVVIIPIALMYYCLQRIYIAASRQLKRLESVSRSPIYSHFGETLHGAHTIRAYSVQERFIEESDNRLDTNQTSEFASIVASRWLGIRLEMVANLVILFAASFAVLNRDTISSGVAGLSIAYSLQITEGLNYLVRSISSLETETVSVERTKEYSRTVPEAAWTITKKLLPKNWPEVGTVEFNDFQVRYRDGLELVLKGISFKINGGEKVGIVGRTGAGKSSLTLSLFRIIESAGGSIIIDGQDISSLGLHDLRSRLTIIPQDPVLFSGTLRLNLDPFEQNSDTELWTALEHAHLKSFVEGLTAGLNHEITEGGENLSVGQRQLVCLARALLRKTKVLILDEATAAVDMETDDLIQQTIRAEFHDCTVLTIAHRLNTIMDSDKVIVLDQGEMCEFASPNELLHNKFSIFYNMAKESGLV
ncbi:Multidrug resistance-associated protein 1 [Pseudolycoriella hygida]|uniref:ABC-type glutathione-S-conjugate transporter n=1 Tax=Pseudolycoriella hygida TaxID=35572 RepID=A0A9Q0S709_9DIPT|nr:Multidrug resistance-associated protein 1 [Pseudolycoriella hygida]